MLLLVHSTNFIKFIFVTVINKSQKMFLWCCFAPLPCLLPPSPSYATADKPAVTSCKHFQKPYLIYNLLMFSSFSSTGRSFLVVPIWVLFMPLTQQVDEKKHEARCFWAPFSASILSLGHKESYLPCKIPASIIPTSPRFFCRNFKKDHLDKTGSK